MSSKIKITDLIAKNGDKPIELKGILVHDEFGKLPTFKLGDYKIPDSSFEVIRVGNIYCNFNGTAYDLILAKTTSMDKDDNILFLGHWNNGQIK